MNPNYFAKICPTTGLFIFFVKEPLEYFGLVIEKRTVIKNALLTFSNMEEYLSSNQYKLTQLANNLC